VGWLASDKSKLVVEIEAPNGGMVEVKMQNEVYEGLMIGGPMDGRWFSAPAKKLTIPIRSERPDLGFGSGDRGFDAIEYHWIKGTWFLVDKDGFPSIVASPV
jgi:hypothetical protein